MLGDGLGLGEVPGLEEKDVKIEVADGRLTVSGEKTFEAERKDKAYHFVERGYGSFSRTIESAVDVTAISIEI